MVCINPMLHLKTRLLPLLLICFFTASCQRNSLDSTLNAPGTCVSKTVGETQVQYVLSNGKPSLVMWGDFVGSQRNTCSQAPDNSYSGEMIIGGSQQIRWEWGTPDGKQSIVAINGIQFDFNKGNVFLVATKNDGIQQLQRNLKTDSNTFEKLSTDDPEVRRFIEAIPQQQK
jgi:hypothetical protein